MMSADLDWTSALGEAVVADQGAVLDAIQVFRRKAQAAGNLKSDDKQVVVVEKEIVTIAPADPQVIYVPQYNPATVVVYGSATRMGLLPDALPVVLLPVPARCRARHRHHLGRGDRRGLERRPLRHALRRQCQHQHRSQHEHQHGQHQHRQHQPPGPAAGRRRRRVEVEQAARPGQQLRRQDGTHRARRRCARERRGWRLCVGRGKRRTGVGAACRRRRARQRGIARSAGLVQRVAARQLWRRRPGRRRRRRVRWLRFRAANADGQLPRRFEPQFDVQCGGASDVERRRCARGGGAAVRGGGRWARRRWRRR